eukprot:PLAT6458.2.p2 GENE.PLAT6458.2~~PLAT6458.2.p2  ORF type:complete len:224 (-),score=89.03 PLAT6458.2:123-794(-)
MGADSSGSAGRVRCGCVAAALRVSLPPARLLSRQHSLMDATKGYAVIDNFLGEEWVPLLIKDAARWRESTELSSGTVGEDWSWVELDALGDSFPALEELVSMLQGIPFELNRKAGVLKLSAVMPGSTLLNYRPSGFAHLQQLDRKGAVTADKISMRYFLSTWEEADGGQLQLAALDGSQQVVQPRADRLLLYRTQTVAIGVPKPLTKQLWELQLWLHGADDEW